MTEAIEQIENIFIAPYDYFTSYVSLYSSILVSLIIGLFLAFVANKNFNIITFFVGVILAFLIYILLSSARSDNLIGSVPSVGYPVPPHLGLGGVSLQNQFPTTG